ncbi:MAG: polymorphic toxin-type HINT domain-containing protein, partial [Planctomycetaceae bacterium]
PARPRRVLNLFETHPIELYHLTIFTADGRRERLGTTGNHPFYEASERRFVPARELRPGCRVVTVTGAIAEVEAVEIHTAGAGESFTTYNIEVEEDHTYHVGELGTWVHNESAERCLKLAREAANGSEEAVEELRRIFRKEPTLRRSIDGNLREIVDDDILRRIDGPGPLPGTSDHKALRWREYRERGGGWGYERWSNVYEQNMVRARAASKIVDDYHKGLGWGRREVTVDINGVARRIDIADLPTRRGVEVKSGYTTLNAEIRSELAWDAELRAQGWDIRWHFEGTASKPLLKELGRLRIPYTGGT